MMKKILGLSAIICLTALFTENGLAESEYAHCVYQAKRHADEMIAYIEKQKRHELHQCEERFEPLPPASPPAPPQDLYAVCMSACQTPCSQAGYSQYHTDLNQNLCTCYGGSSDQNLGPVCYQGTVQ